MRRVWAAAACVLVFGAVLGSAGAASAADFPVRPYSVAATYSWMGPYVGANLGYEWASVPNSPANPSGLAGGVEAGYNWQSGQFVFGGEADLDLSGANDTFAAWKFSNPWFGTLRARGGYAINNVLFYGTVGFAFGDLRVETGGFSEAHTLGGWTAGAGMEVGFTPNWSAKVEYLYMNLGNTNYFLTGLNHGLQSNVLRFGVNYHF